MFVGEELELLLGLHAFRHHRQIEPAAERDHRADDGGRLLAVAEIGDEGLVDLDLVERKRLQIGQRRIAGAKIVHGDAHAEIFQPAQDRHRAGEIADQHAFGDLQFQPRRRQTGLQQNLMHQARQVAVLELHRRQIDGDVQRPRP